MSTPSASANRRSSASLGLSTGADTATPGRLMPLWSETMPPSTTSQDTSVPSDDSAMSFTRPSSISSVSPALRSLARPW